MVAVVATRSVLVLGVWAALTSCHRILPFDVLQPGADAAVVDARPGQGSWKLLAATKLTPRSLHSGVWTGTEMIVWGGSGSGNLYNDGAIYTP
jgi:hypothetical protein